MMAPTIRIEPARFAAGYVIILQDGTGWKDQTGVGHDSDGRKALPAAWRDLARNCGLTVTALKALPRVPARLRIRR
jgi:hypothetical protein